MVALIFFSDIYLFSWDHVNAKGLVMEDFIVRRIKLIAIAAATLAAYGAATFTLASPSAPDGWYLEGNLGSSRSSGVNYGTGTSYSGKGVGWNVNGGYKFVQYFSTEVGFTSYAENSVKASNTKVANVSHYSYDIAGKAVMPLNASGFDLFAKLGLARTHSNVSSKTSVPGVTVNNAGTNNATGAYYGLGGDYSFTPNLSALVQWARAKGNSNIGSLDLVSVGLAYIFD